jgi:hypothetical protein
VLWNTTVITSQVIKPLDNGFWFDTTAFKISEEIIEDNKGLVSDTTNLRKLISQQELDKKDLIYDMQSYKTLYEITEKQLAEVHKGFNLLEVIGIGSLVALVTAIVTVVVK